MFASLAVFHLLVAAGPPPRPEHDPPALPITEARVADQLAVATAAVRKEDWANAARALQAVLSFPEDVLVPDPEGGRGPVLRWVSARIAAGRLVANLPANGRAAYRAANNAEADMLLRRARAGNDPKLVAQVVRRYLHTDAGPQALRALAAHHYQANNLPRAAECYALLLRELGLARWTPEELYQATAAFRRSGDAANGAKTVKHLLNRVPPAGLRLSGRNFTRKQLEAELDRLVPSPATAPGGDWPLYRGDAARSNVAVGRDPVLKALWRQKTVANRTAQRELARAEELLTDSKQPIVPACVPIVVTVKQRRGPARSVLCYRSQWGVQSIDLQTGKTLWWMRSPWSIDGMFGGTKMSDFHTERVQALAAWLDTYLKPNRRPQVVFENSALGTLSCDGKHLFTVDDLAVPWPGLESRNLLVDGRERRFRYGRSILQAIHNNRLQALNVTRFGKLEWELGGSAAEETMPPLPDSFFLGPPLPVEGKLYAVNQYGKTLRLATIEAHTGRVLTVRPLATLHTTIPQDPVRRLQAVHIAYADGNLFIPTNDGTLFCLEAPSGELRWACTYRPRGSREPGPEGPAVRPPPPPPWVPGADGRLVWSRIRQRGWLVTAPAVRGGKVVFTAPDADAVYCLNARDGKLAWSEARRGDLYLGGVFGERVLLVGDGRCRAVRLTDGKPLWNVATGTPSGQGVAVGEVYYLPLRSGAKSKGSEVCVLDLTGGNVRARIPAKEVPGNLVFLDGIVVSQSATTIAAYAQAPAAGRGAGKSK